MSEGPSEYEFGTGCWWGARYRQLLKSQSQTRSHPQTAAESLPSLHDLSLNNNNSSVISSTWTALSSLRTVKGLTTNIYPAQRGDPVSLGQDFNVEQQLILEMISSAIPNVYHFSVVSNLQPLTYLRHFHNLKLLNFCGYSESSPDETLSILRSLPLETLRIEHFGDDFARVNSANLSFTPDVLARIKPLESFSISHYDSSRSRHFTPQMIRSLRRTLEIASRIVYCTLTTCMSSKGLLRELLNFLSTAQDSDLHLVLRIGENLQLQ